MYNQVQPALTNITIIDQVEPLRFISTSILKLDNDKNCQARFWVASWQFLKYHFHNGSSSHPFGNPRALRSISGKSTKSQRSLASISLFGLTTSSKYLIMQISWYTFNGSVGKVIHGRTIRFGIAGFIVLRLFQTRAWWAQSFLVKYSFVIQLSKGGTCNPKIWDTFFLSFLSFRLLKILVIDWKP